MLELVLPHLAKLEKAVFDTDEMNTFKRSLVTKKILKGTNRIDLALIGESLISRSQIATSTVFGDSIVFDTKIGNDITNYHVAAINKSFAFGLSGRVDEVKNSKIFNSDLTVLDKFTNVVVENCNIVGGEYISCDIINCTIEKGKVMNSYVDEATKKNSPNLQIISESKKRVNS